MSGGQEHARLAELFHALLDLSPQAREEALSRLPAEDNARLRQLLNADADTRDPVAEAVREGGWAMLGTTGEGQRLGPWRILRELGAGGMGTVMLAERADGQFEQHVAIKLIRGFPTRDGQRRLRQERQILAQLDHPNIARLIDGGETGDGQPYVVMEYVQGTGLMEYIALHRLALEARLGLFDRIAMAVQHAHGRLVIHRDLKPGNVLVHHDGEPKLLDFGVAKLVAVGAAHAGDASTRVFSPGYASPEQRRGDPVSTATDVYALGVVLREMLTGEREPGVSRVPMLGFEPLRLPADLRGILGHATAPDPARRYPTVEALRADLHRWRSGRPVLAAPDRWHYRAGKFIGRHRIGMFLALTAVLALTGFVWRLALERERALVAEAATAQALVAAESEAQAARASLAFLSRTLAAASPDIGGRANIGVHDLLESARAGIASDNSLSPQARRTVQRLLGNLYLSLGEPANAAAQFAASGLEETPTGREEALALADNLDGQASALATVERFDDALSSARRAAALRQHFAPEDAAARMRSLAELAFVHYRRDELPQAFALWDRLLDEASVRPDAPVDIVMDATHIAASTCLREGETERGLAYARQGLDWATRHGIAVSHPDHINLARVHAELLSEAGHPGEAEPLLREQLVLQERSAGLSGIRAGNLFNALGTTLNQLGRYREAAAMLERAQNLYGQVLKSDVEEAIAQINLAAVLENAGDYAGALSRYDRALALLADTQAGPATSREQAQRGRARTLGLAGRHTEALDALLALRTTLLQRNDASPVPLAATNWQLAVLARRLPDPERGTAWMQQALDGFATVLPEDHPIFAHAHRLRAAFAVQRNDLKTAAHEQDAAVTALDHENGLPVDLAIARAERAAIWLAQGQRRAARRELAHALPILRETLLPDEVNRREAELLATRLGLPAPDTSAASPPDHE